MDSLRVWIIKRNPSQDGSEWEAVTDDNNRLITFESQAKAREYAVLYFDHFACCEITLQSVGGVA